MINLSTGPVSITLEVQAALASNPISHRSVAFKTMYDETASHIRKLFSVNKVFFLTGSGTLANETMLWQIKASGKKGLIIINGEFGDRLQQQATRLGIEFDTYKLSWGQKVDLIIVEESFKQHEYKWLLFCHCETSTGVINPLEKLVEIVKNYESACYVDCMSTVGTRQINLSAVAMATASSGKGFASIPGLGVIFSNVPLSTAHFIPIYHDLTHYEKNDFIPFTLSSNLLHAFQVSIKQKLEESQLNLADHYKSLYRELLQEQALLPFDNIYSNVLTLKLGSNSYRSFINDLGENGVNCSYESKYLKQRKWIQLAFFGMYTEEQLAKGLKTMSITCANLMKRNQSIPVFTS